jgi:hypothetical protein
VNEKCALGFREGYSDRQTDKLTSTYYPYVGLQQYAYGTAAAQEVILHSQKNSPHYPSNNTKRKSFKNQTHQI